MPRAKPVADEATGKMAERVAAALEMRINSNEDEEGQNRPLTPFDSASIPPVTMSAYLSRLARFCQCGGECFVVALFYVDLVTQGNCLSPLSMRNAHRLFLTCLLVAAKFWDDALPLNSHYAKCGGVSLKELNRLEKFFLKTVGFRLQISTHMYAAYETALAAIERLEQESEGERISKKADALIKSTQTQGLKRSTEVETMREMSPNTPSDPSSKVPAKPYDPSTRPEGATAATQEPTQASASSTQRQLEIETEATQTPAVRHQNSGASGWDVNGGVQLASKSAREVYKIQPKEVFRVMPSVPKQWQQKQLAQPAAQKSACPELHSEVTQLWPSSSVPAYPGLPLHTGQSCLTRSAVVINCH